MDNIEKIPNIGYNDSVLNNSFKKGITNMLKICISGGPRRWQSISKQRVGKNIIFEYLKEVQKSE